MSQEEGKERKVGGLKEERRAGEPTPYLGEYLTVEVFPHIELTDGTASPYWQLDLFLSQLCGS